MWSRSAWQLSFGRAAQATRSSRVGRSPIRQAPHMSESPGCSPGVVQTLAATPKVLKANSAATASAPLEVAP